MNKLMTAYWTAVPLAALVATDACPSVARSHGMRQPAWTRAISQTTSSEVKDKKGRLPIFPSRC